MLGLGDPNPPPGKYIIILLALLMEITASRNDRHCEHGSGTWRVSLTEVQFRVKSIMRMRALSDYV